MQSWKRLSSRDILRDRWVRLRADRCEIAPGKIIEPYYVLEETEWVHVFARDAQDRVLLIRQYRYAADSVGYELPGGTTDAGEDLLKAMQRELLEETGCTAENWRHFTAPFANPARQNNRIHCFLADHVRRVAVPELEETEAIEAEFIERARVLELIRTGAVNQATHAGLILAAFLELGWLKPAPQQRP